MRSLREGLFTGAPGIEIMELLLEKSFNSEQDRNTLPPPFYFLPLPSFPMPSIA